MAGAVTSLKAEGAVVEVEGMPNVLLLLPRASLTPMLSVRRGLVDLVLMMERLVVIRTLSILLRDAREMVVAEEFLPVQGGLEELDSTDLQTTPVVRGTTLILVEGVGAVQPGQDRMVTTPPVEPEPPRSLVAVLVVTGAQQVMAPPRPHRLAVVVAALDSQPRAPKPVGTDVLEKSYLLGPILSQTE